MIEKHFKGKITAKGTEITVLSTGKDDDFNYLEFEVIDREARRNASDNKKD